MKKILLFLSFIVFTYANDFLPQNAKLIGEYNSVDEDNKITGTWIIYEENNLLYGKMTKVAGYSDDKICDKCKKSYEEFDYSNDASKMKLVGAPLLYKLKKVSDTEYKNGFIIDPKSGKNYKANAKIIGDKLELRGYIGFSLLGRTQTWIKVK
ncbi:DUF2147 domain-containing protein [Campylobacter canadensis]|uniref:DUF2147 domain-containing protein n=1 Tax=Campylobacter canadensis TaxID=449520 RepID=A0ABS7WR41_9BACT|nr:DUF2147 domain-containing protein [Campylobacter canadensis]MBZ7986539.1 DUF2147 domain-containing protein [Campylobacter canadensis]MBZ7994056.1 DUF2147 domain-containing protein [Campylobacter canadensis]MBZ7995941.1 DUF2147 domain-containing protein [Campylobacter canadensis]MBZ7997575.1 DUF2147 domain-containing protein [Campylobacter canadensis]MBZ7999387.1 DUF2147 domain-containing protein [Campylobacter canadensis]